LDAEQIDNMNFLPMDAEQIDDGVHDETKAFCEFVDKWCRC